LCVWAPRISFSCAAMAFFPLPAVLVGAVVGVVAALAITVDMMPGVRQSWARRLGRRGRQCAGRLTDDR